MRDQDMAGLKCIGIGSTVATAVLQGGRELFCWRPFCPGHSEGFNVSLDDLFKF